MSESRLFTVRPLPAQLRNDLKDCFRVYLSASSLASLKLRSGDLCSLRLPDMPPKTAIVWAALENIQNTIVQTSKTLQDCYGFKLGDKLIMKMVDEQLEEAESVTLEECTDSNRLSIYGSLPSLEKEHWEWCLEYPLSKCGILSAGLVFEIELKGHRRSFKVMEILAQNRTSSNTIYQLSKTSTTISIKNQVILKHGIELQVQASSLGGVSSQVRRINECLLDFNSNVQRLAMPSFYEHTCGLLIYGPKGTGKTALLRQIEAAGWKRSFTIGSSTLCRNVGDGEAHLRRIFQAALLSQPSVIIIDQVEFIAPKRMSLESSSLAYVLCEGIETLRTAKVLVVAATRHPNDVDDSLRTPHRLAVEIELSVPTAEARSGILRAIRGSCAEPNDRLIDFIARKTHGYVGADLFALLQLTCRKARDRELSEGELHENFDISLQEAEAPTQLNGVLPPLRIQEKDILSATQEIRPTAMREVFLETPKVKWSDIGGQHEIKKRLQNVVQRPLKFPDRMRRLNVNSKKGILLYGPPGCSKTLTVKALASGSGLNFLAVKGAEILNMYVGESERILREIFQKARAASPSIIFFDEIDAIASKRSSTSHGSVNVLTTLLNEMDGIEELRNVLVIAATNKPEMLDPALMRPGRLDNILYIGLPDLEARTEILKIWTSKSAVHPEVDVNQLALKTEGYSGAEMVNICETAGEAVLDEEEAMNQPREIMWHHFEYALGQVKRQITAAILHEYERWQKSLVL
ncbi:hypothetical protein Egran_02376 [Elaphomyces granulatus]|uniref:AAA+ ATPase domain-containing protein n=1 Tax=Elaphomyces granulatus TaxID=519963 RepID=A0A232M0C2_9EURO|nr:hypothetical protein Egran_02376 [Elaphomyces granulatus]